MYEDERAHLKSWFSQTKQNRLVDRVAAQLKTHIIDLIWFDLIAVQPCLVVLCLSLPGSTGTCSPMWRPIPWQVLTRKMRNTRSKRLTQTRSPSLRWMFSRVLSKPLVPPADTCPWCRVSLSINVNVTHFCIGILTIIYPYLIRNALLNTILQCRLSIVIGAAHYWKLSMLSHQYEHWLA